MARRIVRFNVIYGGAVGSRRRHDPRRDSDRTKYWTIRFSKRAHGSMVTDILWNIPSQPLPHYRA